MSEVILAIAALCLVHPSSNAYHQDIDGIDKHQLKCQQYYAKCMKGKLPAETPSDIWLRCVGERTL